MPADGMVIAGVYLMISVHPAAGLPLIAIGLYMFARAIALLAEAAGLPHRGLPRQGAAGSR